MVGNHQLISNEAPGDRGGGAPGDDGDGPSILKDDAFHLLQHRRRRALLRFMFTNEGGEFWVDVLAASIAAWEHDTTPENLSHERFQRVYLDLYQSQLPKLAEHGIVVYDQDQGLVSLCPLAQVLKPYLDETLHADERLRLSDVDPSGESRGFLSDLFSI